MQAVEVERPERQRLAHRGHIELATEAPHRHLKGMRDAGGPTGKGFAIQDECVSRNALGLFDYLRNRSRYIVHCARAACLNVFQSMEMQPPAIYLVLCW